MTEKIRVVQYGVGDMGLEILKRLVTNPKLQLVGAIDRDPSKIGKDVGELLNHAESVRKAESFRKREKMGILVSDNVHKVLRNQPDIVIHTTGSYLKEVHSQWLPCFEAGAHVLSTCEELVFPFLKYPGLAKTLDEQAKAHEVTLLGLGVNPGFIMDRLVVFLASSLQTVHSIHVTRKINVTKRRPSFQRKVGMGLTLQEFEQKLAQGTMKHVGLMESLTLVAHALGLSLDQTLEDTRPVLSEAELVWNGKKLPPGSVIALHQQASGISQGKQKIMLELQMGINLDPEDCISIEGDYSIHQRIQGGIPGDEATANLVLSAIPVVLTLQRPGLRTILDLPLL